MRVGYAISRQMKVGVVNDTQPEFGQGNAEVIEERTQEGRSPNRTLTFCLCYGGFLADQEQGGED